MSDTFEIQLDRLDGYRFRTQFGLPGVPDLLVDEPPPLGAGAGPNPARLLAAAVGDCLSASLVFCLARSHVEIARLSTKVVGTYRRNERGRLRIGRLDAAIEIDVPGSDPERLKRCLALFEDYCTVTGSVRQGIEVTVTVDDVGGNRLFPANAS